MIERYTVDCEDCAGIGLDEDGGDCTTCDGWGEACNHCGRPAGQCSYYQSGIECQPVDESRSVAALRYSDTELLSFWNNHLPIPVIDKAEDGAEDDCGPDETVITFESDGAMTYSNPKGLPASLLRSLGLNSAADAVEATNKKASPQAGD